jgi:hypothetical protein
VNVKRHKTDNTSKTGDDLHLTLREGGAGLRPENPETQRERLMKEISLRATVVGPVLESVLHEAHGKPRWGLNK